MKDGNKRERRRKNVSIPGQKGKNCEHLRKEKPKGQDLVKVLERGKKMK